MKKIILLLAFLLSFVSVKAQEDNTNTQQNFNEVKLNGLYLVLGALEGTYERTLNEESAFGVSLFLPIDDDVSDDVNYYISPYYRMYFGKKYASGFYLEGFGMLNSIVDEDYNNQTYTYDEKTVTDFALGIGVGGKWVTNKGFLGEIGLGIGRNLFNADDGEELIGKLAITLGYRF